MGRALCPITPPFTKRHLGNRLWPWRDELEIAYAFCQEHGLTIHSSDANYQVAVLQGDGVRLLLYPHTTKSTRNKSLRVRDEGSADRDRATDLMIQLYQAAVNILRCGQATLAEGAALSGAVKFPQERQDALLRQREEAG